MSGECLYWLLILGTPLGALRFWPNSLETGKAQRRIIWFEIHFQACLDWFLAYPNTQLTQEMHLTLVL